MVGGDKSDDHFYLKLWAKLTNRYSLIAALSRNTCDKRSISTNRKSTTSFQWAQDAHVASKPQRGLKNAKWPFFHPKLAQ